MFGERLQQLRKNKRLNQEEMATTLCVNPRTYGSWERNEREPSFSDLCRIADFHGVTADYLLGRSDMKIEVKKESPPALAEGQVEFVIPLDGSVDAPSEFDEHVRKLIRQELSRRGIE